MKKKNIIAVFASLALVLTMFAACGKGDDGESTNPTVIGADGQVYEEVTEVVTDASGEAVTDAEGNTQVVTVTKPVEATTGEGDKAVNATTAGTNGEEITTTYEDVAFPEGEEIEVEVNDEGRPKDSKMDKLLGDTSENQSFYISLTFVNDQTLGGALETGATVKFYMKGSKFAVEMPLGITSIRAAYDGKSMNLILPATKYYYSAPMEDDGSMLDQSKNMWDSLDATTMDYDSTTNVKIRGVEYVCEIYSDGTNLNKYYFNSNDELKRIEIVEPDGTTTIIKVNECSSKVDDSIFSVPKGYKPMSEDTLAGMLGNMGLTA